MRGTVQRSWAVDECGLGMSCASGQHCQAGAGQCHPPRNRPRLGVSQAYPWEFLRSHRLSVREGDRAERLVIDAGELRNRIRVLGVQGHRRSAVGSLWPDEAMANGRRPILALSGTGGRLIHV